MEHVLQIGISVDDDAIVRSVTEAAEKQIIKELKNDVEHQLFKFDRHWSGETKCGIQDWVKEQVNDFLDVNKNEIIERAAWYLADKMSRTKVVKEAMLVKITGESEGDEA